jgi:adenylyltransferase/sulfurtransferase
MELFDAALSVSCFNLDMLGLGVWKRSRIVYFKNIPLYGGIFLAKEDRYNRFRVLDGIGETGLLQIRKAKVAVVGIGGLGSVSVRQLASLGVGTIRIVDRDIVELSNLQRQLLYTDEDVGKPKVEVAMNRLKQINPEISVEPLAISVTETTANRVVNGMDVVVDGLDSFKPRYAVNRACVLQGIPYMFAGALAGVGNLTTIIPGKTACLECIFGGVDEDQPTCATVGIYPTVLGVIANLQVQEVLHLILGQPSLLANRLLMFDITRFRLDQIPLQSHEGCQVCGPVAKLTRPKSPAGLEITELCTDETFLVHAQAAIPIDLERATTLLRAHYPIRAQTSLGVQIQFTKGIDVSIVGEGNVLIRGINSKKKAESIYHQIISEIGDALIQ